MCQILWPFASSQIHPQNISSTTAFDLEDHTSPHNLFPSMWMKGSYAHIRPGCGHFYQSPNHWQNSLHDRVRGQHKCMWAETQPLNGPQGLVGSIITLLRGIWIMVIRNNKEQPDRSLLLPTAMLQGKDAFGLWLSLCIFQRVRERKVSEREREKQTESQRVCAADDSGCTCVCVCVRSACSGKRGRLACAGGLLTVLSLWISFWEVSQSFGHRNTAGVCSFSFHPRTQTFH